MKTTSTALTTNYLNHISVGAAAIAALSTLLYGILLLMTVMHAAARQDAQTHINTLATQVASLETEYLQQTQAITSNTATQLGFVVPTQISTVYANSGTRQLTLSMVGQ